MKHIRILLITLMAGLFIEGCVDLPNEIIMPEWDVDINIPITNKYLTLEDFIDKENLYIDPADSIYILQSKEYTQTRNLLDFIRINQAIEQSNIPLPLINDSSDIYLDFRSNVVEMDSAVFAGGLITFNFINNSSSAVTYSIIIPGITLNRQVLSITIPLAPGETRNIQQDLTGYTFSQPQYQPDLVRNRLWIKIKSNTSGNSSSGLVFFDVQISEFKFRSVTGSFAEQNLGRKTDTYEADFGKDVEGFRNKLKLSTAALIITAQYHTMYKNPFDLRIDSLNVIARSGNGEIYLTDSTGSRNISFIIQNGDVKIFFNEKNSNILDIINSIPQTFEVGASIKILGKNQSGTLSDQDITIIGIELSTISKLAFGRSTISDTTTLDITETDREEIRKAKNGSFGFDILNSIPINGWLKTEFYDSLKNKVFTLRVDNRDSVKLEGAAVNQIGEVTTPSPTIKSINLTEEEIKSISRAYFVATSISMETSGYNKNNPLLVSFRASDGMRVKISGKIKYRVKNL